MSKFIICDANGIAYVVDCGRNSIFSETVQSCLYRNQYNGTIYDNYCGIFSFGFEPFSGTPEQAAMQLGSESMKLALRKRTNVRVVQGPSSDALTKTTLIESPNVIYTDATGHGGNVGLTKQTTTKFTDIRPAPGGMMDGTNFVRNPVGGLTRNNFVDVRNPVGGSSATNFVDVRNTVGGSLANNFVDVRNTVGGSLANNFVDVRNPVGGSSATNFVDVRTPVGGSLASNFVDVRNPIDSAAATNFVDVRSPIDRSAATNFVDVRAPVDRHAGGATTQTKTTFTDIRTGPGGTVGGATRQTSTRLTDIRTGPGITIGDPTSQTMNKFTDIRSGRDGPLVPAQTNFLDVRAPTSGHLGDVTRKTATKLTDIRTGPGGAIGEATRQTTTKFTDIRPNHGGPIGNADNLIDIRNPTGNAAAFVDIRTVPGEVIGDRNTFIDIRSPTTGLGGGATNQITTKFTDIRATHGGTIGDASSLVDIRNPTGGRNTASFVDVRRGLDSTLLDTIRPATTNFIDVIGPTAGAIGAAATNFIDVIGPTAGAIGAAATNFIDIRNPTIGPETTQFIDIRNPINGVIGDGIGRATTDFVDIRTPSRAPIRDVTGQNTFTDIRTPIGSNLLSQNTGSFLEERNSLTRHGRGPDLGHTTGQDVIGFSDMGTSGRREASVLLTDGTTGHGVNAGMALTNPLAGRKTNIIGPTSAVGENQFDINNMLTSEPNIHTGFQTTGAHLTALGSTGLAGSLTSSNAQLLSTGNEINLGQRPITGGQLYGYGSYGVRPRVRDQAQQRTVTRTVTVTNGGQADLSSMNSISGTWQGSVGSAGALGEGGVTSLRSMSLHTSQMKDYDYSGIPYTEPCTAENIAEGRMYFRYLRDPHRFIQCDETGTMHLRICSTFGRDWFDIYSNTCVDGPVHVDDQVVRSG